MCTLTIHRSSDNTIITMNRDELRGRPENGVRRSASRQGTEYLFPIDGLSGGTWMGINTFGIGGCLLNRYGETHPGQSSRIVSRGTIIPQLLECRSLESAWRHLDRAPLSHLRNFDIVLFDDTSILQLTHENGHGHIKRITADWLMLTSSSWNADAVVAYRQRRFDQFLRSKTTHCRDIATSVLSDFHLHNTDDSRFSVLMKRDESHTKSVSQITMNPHTISLRYLDEHSLNQRTGKPDITAISSHDAIFSMNRKA